jgi:hypothetical protein
LRRQIEALKDEVLDEVRGCQWGSTCVERLEDFLAVFIGFELDDHCL